MPPIISIENLGKSYLIGHQSKPAESYTALRDVIGEKAKSFGRKALNLARGRQIVSGDHTEEFWALRDVSFDIDPGDVIGIIGSNGAGKSTLLKILSRITEPTRGRICLNGRVASLLEVGTGFHPELSGRENIFLNGAVLGMNRREILKKFDEIVAFAEVEKFLDTPVKRYSSGMYVRLAFAVAAHLEPEILVVDEVLAVGDINFQKKCLGKMSDVSKGGRTVLFVSHNMAAVRSLCPRGVVLEKGHVAFEGPVIEAIEHYSNHSVAEVCSKWTRNDSPTQSPIRIHQIESRLSGKQPCIKLHCDIAIECSQSCSRYFMAADIFHQSHSPIAQALPETECFIEGTPGIHDVHLEIDLPPLIPGIYSVDFWAGPHYKTGYDYVKKTISFEITESPIAGRSHPHKPEHGCIVSPCRYHYKSFPVEAKIAV